MHTFGRRARPRVRHGRVQPQNRIRETPSYWNTRLPDIVIDVLRPGRGHRHVVRKRDVEAFIELIPDWAELSRGLSAVILDEGGDCDGYYAAGRVIAICAFERDLVVDRDAEYVRAHAGIFERLGVETEPHAEGALVHFTRGTARAFLLLHVFLHELGHHVDRMTTRSRHDCARGEPFAEAFAFEV